MSLTPDLLKARALAQELAKSVLQRPEGAGERAERLEAAELPSLSVYAGVLVRGDEKQVEGALKALSCGRPAIDRAELLESIREPLPDTLAADIVEGYIRRQPDLPSRARYNVACFYARLSKNELVPESERKRCRKKAFAELELVFNDASLIPWAKQDPALEPLRAREVRWAKLLSDHEIPPTAPPAAQPPPGKPSASAAAGG